MGSEEAGEDRREGRRIDDKLLYLRSAIRMNAAAPAAEAPTDGWPGNPDRLVQPIPRLG